MLVAVGDAVPQLGVESYRGFVEGLDVAAVRAVVQELDGQGAQGG
ncbi:hypothetical protein ACF1BN_03750 [Streptomyces sp. NPDC014861]